MSTPRANNAQLPCCCYLSVMFLVYAVVLLLQTTLPSLCPCCCCLSVVFLGYLLLLLSLILLTPFPLLAPLLLLLIRDDHVRSSVASTPASNSGNNKNRSDVNGSTDAINSKQTRTITDKQQQQGGVLADTSNRHMPGTSRTSNSSTEC